MKKKLWMPGIALLFAICSANAQTPQEGEQNTDESKTVVAHTVEMGETVMLIAKKYHIKPTDIYLLNPDAVNGISYNTVLQIPADKKYVAKHKIKEEKQADDSRTITQTTP